MAATQAAARPALPTLVQDDAQLLHRSEADVRASLATLARLGVDRVRVTAGWSVLTRDADADVPPLFDQSDPAAYEQDRWAALDRVVRLAREAGLEPMLDIAFWAPHWATSDRPGPRARTWIDSEAYGRFAAAVARRYDGTFVPPAVAAQAGALVRTGSDDRELHSLFGAANPAPPSGAPGIDSPLGLLDGGPASTRQAPAGLEEILPTSAEVNPPGAALPAVTTFTLWNEPNHPAFLMPQWKGRGAARAPLSPHLYRELVARAYPAVKLAQPAATVLVGGLAAHASGGGVPPLRFLRDLACVDDRLQPVRRGRCAGFQPVAGDGFAHHPYSLRTEPEARNPPDRPDDAPIGELGRLTALVDRLVAAGRLAPGWAGLWITEYGYETNPPDPNARFTTGDQARFLTRAEFLAWSDPHVRAFAQFLLRDLPPAETRQSRSARRGFGQWESGLAFADGRPKLAAVTFEAGIHARRLAGSRRVAVWGHIRSGTGTRTATLQLRRDGGAWTTVRSRAPRRRKGVSSFPTEGVFERRVTVAPGGRVRLRWLDGTLWRESPSVSPK